MPRVNWPDRPFTSEASPLLRTPSNLQPVSEEEEDLENGLTPSTPPQGKWRKGILIGTHAHKCYGTDSRAYSPLQLRRRPVPADPPLWKTAVAVAGATVLLACIIVATLLLDTVQHPTGPFPRPPSSGNLEPDRNPAYLITASSGAVASENVVCSNIGVDVLKEGGNAVDSAVAVTFCIGVVNLFS